MLDYCDCSVVIVSSKKVSISLEWIMQSLGFEKHSSPIDHFKFHHEDVSTFAKLIIGQRIRNRPYNPKRN